MPEGERKKKKRKEEEEPGARELLGARCNDNAFCRMTDSFHIAGGCIADAWVDAWIRPRTSFPYYTHYEFKVTVHATTSRVLYISLQMAFFIS